jgi:hypothetical protein
LLRTAIGQKLTNESIADGARKRRQNEVMGTLAVLEFACPPFWP